MYFILHATGLIILIKYMFVTEKKMLEKKKNDI